jgi:hypothetical protein
MASHISLSIRSLAQGMVTNRAPRSQALHWNGDICVAPAKGGRRMGKGFSLSAVPVAAVILSLAFFASVASASTYQYDPVMTLAGTCSTSPSDPVPDPGCPDRHPPKGFDEPRSVAIDRYGNMYIASFAFTGSSGRIDIFDDEGKFITELLDPNGPKSVAVDTEGNLYVYEMALGGTAARVVRYEPSEYKPAEDKIAYGKPGVPLAIDELPAEVPFNGGVAVDTATNHLFVAGGTYIAEYSSAEEGNDFLTTIEDPITPGGDPKLFSTNSVAVDGQRRRLYASSCQNDVFECGVLVFEADAPHDFLEEIDGSSIVPEGEFRSQKGWLSIAVNEKTGHFFVDDLENTKNVYEFDENYGYVSTIRNSAFQGGSPLQIAVSNAEMAFNYEYLFVGSNNRGGSRVIAYKPVLECPAGVEAASIDGVGETEAIAEAIVEPCGFDTSYRFELEREGSGEASVIAEGAVSPGAVKTVHASLHGLAAGTAYRLRVTVTNAKGGDEEEIAFSTYPNVSGPGEVSCPNASLRPGFSAALPDCRAYELVTPPDTNGRPPKGIAAGVDNHFPTLLSSPSGGSVSFLLEGGPLPGFEGTGGFNGDAYRATRGASGWTSIGAGPSGTETDTPLPGSYSRDQGYLFWAANGEGTAVIDGRSTNYVRYPDGHSELIGQGSEGIDPGATGVLVTEGGRHIIFETKNFNPFQAQKLEPNAPPTGTWAIYDRTSDGKNHVVSLLPGDETPKAGEHADYLDASDDGEGVAFAIGNKIYVRVNNSDTYEVAVSATFAGISEGGKRVFYVKGGDLFAFDTESKDTIQFTETGDAVVVNVAAAGSRAYFVSTTAIGDSGENPFGVVPEPGARNLYLSEEGQIRFVGTVTPRDVDGEFNQEAKAQRDGLGLWVQAIEQPAVDPSRSTPDGTVLIFQSRANLTGYEPGDLPQIYRYESVSNRLHCISCIPTGIPATGGASLQSMQQVQSGGATSNLPLNSYAFVPNLRPDGHRAFFQSTEALVVTDTNGVQDVYEWEEEGVGSCAQEGGCVYLISSGGSARPNYLYGVSASGDDVFFITDDSLVLADSGTPSIYDARVGGGFPQPLGTECQGEGCRPNMTVPPSLPSSAKPVPTADDQVRPKRRCPRGKRAVRRHGKVRCVKKKRQSKHRQSGAKKGAAK